MKIAKLFIIAFATIVLTACAESYKVEVDLTPQEIADLQVAIGEAKVNIDKYEGPEGTFPYLDIIDLAEAQADLGEVGKAISIYEDAMKDGLRGTSIYNNVGRLYEKIGDYERAIAMYQKIMDEFFDQDYLYDITWAYIRAGDRKSAEKYFNAWQLEFQKTDEQTQVAIKELRAAEGIE